jgi:hypothetical protein
VDVEEILDEYAATAEWSLKQQLEKCLLYIGRQKDNDAFEEFLADEAEDSRGDEEEEGAHV